ncbi:Tetratricopeptide repeat protein 37 [Phytophthora boehmeriae]|uniref:Tetratricopeptide repeat protein 37 n=1 Tax=Phytophthora boehmeriae TaxID=109152 RepID=A0A8T1XC91_9STRA|nr:Tetratricopeptide repeat protein 37 [Phytophthora boehmeriae]
MSATMLRQMLVDAAAALKAERYQEAQDAARRVTQFDPNNFQAFMCVGLSSFHLKEWEDCEEAYRRAVDIKPELPVPWKHLVDLFEERKDAKSKLKPLEKLVEINLKGKKLKRCQKWVAEVAVTALELKMFTKAFDSWYTLVGEQEGEVGQLSLGVTPNDELPVPLSIWLDLVDLLQRPGFSLSDCSGTYSKTDISRQFFAATFRTDWTSGDARVETLRLRMDAAIAYFIRFQLDELKATSSKQKAKMLKTLDTLTISINEKFPAAKIPAEFLLLRCEDQDSHKAIEVADGLRATHSKSPMVLVFQALKCLNEQNNHQAREHFVEALAGYSSSSFHESSLCIRSQVELASLALAERDVEGCLQRLALAKKVVADKAQALGYSEAKVIFMMATAHEYSGDMSKALEAYCDVMAKNDVVLKVKAAIAAAELLVAKAEAEKALETIDTVPLSEVKNESSRATMLCTRGWLLFQQGNLHGAQELLETNVQKLSSADVFAKGRSLKRLAIVYWHLGGSHQTAKTGCFGHLLQAAKLTPSDAQIFSWLGKWYQEVAKDILRAEKCFLKALSLSPTDELAGTTLSGLYDQQGKYEANVALWERVTQDQETAPTWALLRLAQHLVDNNDEAAVGKLHLVLRNDPMNARYWVILAHVYHNFDKQISAQRSYLKAIELGEKNWCVRCELARIEGSLGLFDDALERIEPIVSGTLANGSPDVTAATMIYADLLFQQAKHLCAEGMYGYAATNLKEASRMMKTLPSTSSLSGSVEACKLIGDIHCFAFYLSPENFSCEKSSWVEFIREGRKAYEAAALLAGKVRKAKVDVADTAAAERCYDIGLSYWYEAQAVDNVRGVHTPVFSVQREVTSDTTVAKLKAKASTNFKMAIQEDSSCSLAWNGLALVSDNLLVKQFAWARAVQTGSCSDATWANLGMFYLNQADAVPSMASLAQKSFLQLQSVNPSNPSMWNGYAMLARRQASSPAKQRKAIEAFDCALQIGLDLDALLGLSMALLDYEQSVGEWISQTLEHGAEHVMFYLKKYLERDPFNARAWHALGVAQHRLGLYAEALASYTRAASPTETPTTQGDLEWNTLVTKLGKMFMNPDSAAADETTLLQTIASQMRSAGASSALQGIMQVQLLYRQSKGDASLDLLKKLLSQEDLQPNESKVIACVGLSIASSLRCEYTTKASDIASMCKDLLFSWIDQTETTPTSADYLNLRLVELYDRIMDAEGVCLTRLQGLSQSADDAKANSLWLRLSLATIDSQSLQVSACLSDYLRSSAISLRSTGIETADHNLLDALVGLIKAGPSRETGLSVDAQKLIRAQPWNPHAYVLAGFSILKRISFDAKQESHEAIVRKLLRLLQTGLSLANSSGNEYDAAQLGLLTSYCYTKLGEHDQAAACSLRVLTRVQEGQASGTMANSVDTNLLKARLLSISNPTKAIETYLSVLTSISDSASPYSDRLVPVLSELGGFYEEQGVWDAAISTWKLVASVTSSKMSGQSEGDDDASSTTTALSSNSDTGACFLANLRLALIHGKKSNVKPARKHIKTALTLAESVSDSNSVTVAAFVENVIAS